MDLNLAQGTADPGTDSPPLSVLLKKRGQKQKKNDLLNSAWHLSASSLLPADFSPGLERHEPREQEADALFDRNLLS